MKESKKWKTLNSQSIGHSSDISPSDIAKTESTKDSKPSKSENNSPMNGRNHESSAKTMQSSPTKSPELGQA